MYKIKIKVEEDYPRILEDYNQEYISVAILEK